jgi:hypothetical protein
MELYEIIDEDEERRLREIDENHKGIECWVDGRLCQEGYCEECEVAIDWLSNNIAF